MESDPQALRVRIEQLEAERDRLITERDRLTTERDRLTTEREQLAAERERYRELYLKMMELCRKLELGIAGQKSERRSAEQTQLAMSLLDMLLGNRSDGNSGSSDASPDIAPPADDSDKQRVREHERKKHTGRRELPENLPLVEIEVLPPEVEREGTDAFERIGQETSEVLERRRASLVRVRTIRPKFVRKDRERNAETTISIAEPPELPIERGLAGPGLLADTIVRRWQDHQPLNRMEQIYARDGFELDRSTICTWHGRLAELVAPVVLAMWTDAFTSSYLCTDATGVLVQAKEKCRYAHFFVVVAPERHVLFAYTPKHDQDAFKKILRNYRGHLVADAHAVYELVYQDGVIEVGCWAHARRYFWKSLGTDPERAHKGLALIGELFHIERTVATAPPGKRRSVRRQQSKPVVERFFAWCDEEAERVLDETPISKAIGYARNQRLALTRFLDDERLPIDNNISERALRREVVGRKNWLFVGNDDAGHVNANFVSLLASCQLHGIEPWEYLRDLLCLLPRWPARRVLEIAPVYWKQTRQQQETQLLLDANIFRRATLDPSESHRVLK